MKHVVMYSGGLTSFAVARRVVKRCAGDGHSESCSQPACPSCTDDWCPDPWHVGQPVPAEPELPEALCYCDSDIALPHALHPVPAASEPEADREVTRARCPYCCVSNDGRSIEVRHGGYVRHLTGSGGQCSGSYKSTAELPPLAEADREVTP